MAVFVGNEYQEYVPIKSDMTVEWHEEELSLSMFVKLYENSLPLLIQVTEGNSTLVDESSFRSGDMFWVQEFHHLQSVIVRDINQTKFSIPIDYSHSFEIIWPWGERSQPLKLRDIVNEWKIFAKNFDILPVHNMRTDYSSISSSGNEVKTQMGRMTLEDTYDEMFLLAHPLFDGNIYAPRKLIPLSDTIKVNVAKNLLPQTLRKIDRCCAMLSTVPFDIEAAMTIRQLPDYSDDYVYLEPITFCQTTHSPVDKPNLLPNTPTSKNNNKRDTENSHIFETVKIKSFKRPPPIEHVISMCEYMKLQDNGQLDTDYMHNPFVQTQDILGPSLPHNEIMCSNYDSVNAELTNAKDDFRKANKPSQLAPSLYENVDVLPTIDGKRAEKVINDLTSIAFSEMSTDQVVSLINYLFPTKPQYMDVMALNEVDGVILSALNKDILHKECGFDLVDAVKLVKFLRGIRRPQLAK